MPSRIVRIEKGPASSRRAGPHSQEQAAAERTAREQDSLDTTDDQLSPPAVIEAAVAAIVAGWTDLDEPHKADVLGRLAVLRRSLPDTISLQEAAFRAGRSENTLATWCRRFGLGQRVGGRWVVDPVRLDAFRAGDRS